MVVALFYKVCLVVSISLIFCLGNWLVVWASMELMTALLVVLLGSGLTPRTVEGVSKYYVIQAVASALLLLGVLIRFLLSGEVSLFGNYGGISYVLMLLGLFMKMAVFPKPFWFIDVVSGIGLLRGFYVMMTSKMIPVYIFVMMVGESSQTFLLLVGMMSVGLGSILGVNQTSVRKIVALSSVAHLGWLVVGMPYLTTSGCFFIFICYLLMVFPLLWMSGIYEVSDLNKMKRIYFHPYLLVFFMVSLLSLGGFPPLIGFIYKWVIFMGLLSQGAYLMSSYLMLMSLISLFFYLRLCYKIYSLYWPEPKLNLAGSYVLGGETWSLVWMNMVMGFSALSVGILCLGPLSLYWGL